MSGTRATTAIVVGAGMAGLMTARVLSDHIDQVTILERDRLPDDAVARKGVPQGRHTHVLLAAGQRLLEGWFPGLADELLAHGAIPIDAAQVVWHQGGGYRVPSDLGFLSLSMSRPLLETVVRQRLLRERSAVSLADQTAVDGLILEDGRVVGVRVDGAQHRADLVVACSGRHTRLLDQLVEEGFPPPTVSAVGIDMAFGSRMMSRRPSDLEGTLAVVVSDPSRGRRTGLMVPVEGDRWIITLSSVNDDTFATEPDAFADFARSLPSPVITDVLTRAETQTPVQTYRMLTSQRRHVERLVRTPPGFLILGDAICSFNPIYAQGMSSAALQTQALDRALARHGAVSPALAPAFYRSAARVVDLPWKVTVRADLADPRTTGPAPAGTRLVNWYRDKVFRACHTSTVVAGQTLRVQNLLARPGSLLTPAMVARVLLAARRRRHSARNASTWDRNSPQAGSDAVSR